MSRAQAYTLEAFVASILLIAGLVVAMQLTAVTPLSASTANEHVENQQGRLAAGVLDAGIENRTVKPTILSWNDTNGTVYGTDASYYPTTGPSTAFGAVLNRTLSERRYAYNLDVEYVGARGDLRTERLVHMGTPSETVAVVSRTVTLYDGDRIRNRTGAPTGPTLTNASTFYAPDVAPGRPLYNVVRVEVVLWRL